MAFNTLTPGPKMLFLLYFKGDPSDEMAWFANYVILMPRPCHYIKTKMQCICLLHGMKDKHCAGYRTLCVWNDNFVKEYSLKYELEQVKRMLADKDIPADEKTAVECLAVHLQIE